MEGGRPGHPRPGRARRLPPKRRPKGGQASSPAALRISGKRRGRASMRMLPVGHPWRPARTVQIVCRAGGAGMAKGWQGEGGISDEGVEVLGWGDALPREAHRELCGTVESIFRAQGCMSVNGEGVV